MEKFKLLLESNLSLLKPIESRGFTVPTEIQEKSIPKILCGMDVIAGASTGSGKTLAFAMGLINNAKKNYGVQGLVLTPTRELTEQVAQEISEFAKDEGLNVIPVYGGVSISNQIKKLRSAEIVVGTPGRILDHLRRNSIDLSQINTLVLDEADRMLDMGFKYDVEKIISQCSKKRQTLLFSATISREVINLAKKYMKEQIEISAKSLVDPEKLEQCYYNVGDDLKYSLLKHLLESEKSKLVMIFCSTRRNVDFVANNLQFMGINALPIHGGYSQEKRTRIIKSFHSENTHILVATDVAARGLDIPGVTHVYNYDIPKTKDDYIHRIGRTARAGNAGKVLNILSSRDYGNFDNLMRSGLKISLKETPLVQKVFLKKMPERRGFRNNRGGGFGSGRSSGGFGNRGGGRSSRGFRSGPKSLGNGGGKFNRSSRGFKGKNSRRVGKRSGDL